jgi:hypothetical protein
MQKINVSQILLSVTDKDYNRKGSVAKNFLVVSLKRLGAKTN